MSEELTLTIDPRAPDQCVKPGTTGYALRRSVSPFLRRDGNAAYLHSNVVLGVRDASGRDASARCRLMRQRRLWTVGTDVPGAIAGGTLEIDWHDDAVNESGGWADAPGAQIAIGNLGATMHQAQEFYVFAIAPDGPTALMGFYHFQILSVGRGIWRVQQSAGRPVSFFDWLRQRSLPRPWIAGSGAAVAADSGPQRF